MGSTDLSLVDLESYRSQGRGKSAGKYLRYYCPLHGSDKQRSLVLVKRKSDFPYLRYS